MRMRSLLLVSLFSTGLFAQTDVDVSFYGYGSLEGGQIVKGWHRVTGDLIPKEISHIWQQRTFCNFGFLAKIGDNLTINLGGEGLLAFSTPQINTEPQTMKAREFFYIKQANARIDLGDPEKFALNIQIGLFPYKYNPDVRNLGEYLFRTGTYPLLIYADFDYAMANILGFKVSKSLDLGFLKINNDLMLHSELMGIPVQDWSVSDILSLNLFDMVTLGGGLSFSHLFSVYKGEFGTGWNENYYDLSDPDRIKKMDDEARSRVRIINGDDTLYADWGATKVMARINVDIKKVLPGDFWGEHDLKLYGEADLIGVRNVPTLFEFPEDRTMFSFGFNFPGFKFVDIINTEMEYCANRKYLYSDETFYGGTPPVNYITMRNETYQRYNIPRNPWRWSIYLKKTIFDGHVGFVAQASRDHKKLNYYYFAKKDMYFDEVLPNGDNWQWILKTEFKF